MNIMKKIEQERKRFAKIEKDMDNFIREKVSTVKTGHYVTPHYTGDRLMISIHDGTTQPVSVIIGNIEFRAVGDVPVAQLQEMYDLIMEADKEVEL